MLTKEKNPSEYPTLVEALFAALNRLPANDSPPRRLKIIWDDQSTPLLVEVHFQDKSEGCYMDSRVLDQGGPDLAEA
jgi:hypothetical protein